METIENFLKNRLVNKIIEYTNDDNISNPDIYIKVFVIEVKWNTHKN